MNNSALPWILFAVGVGLAGYALLSDDAPQNNNSFNTLRPGQRYGGYTNNTGAEVYINAAGDILNALGNIIGNIAQFTNNNNNSDDSNNNPSGSDVMAPYYGPGGIGGRWSTGYM
jgi:hypothetical protein